MGILVAALIGGLATAAASLVGRVLIALFIGFVAYQGVDIALAAAKSHIFEYLGQEPGIVLNVLGLLNVDRSIEVVFSAIAARLVLNGLTGGSMKKMIFK